jgi:hypothetical protein
MIYRGVAQADGSDVISLTGYGVGGAIDGLRLEETITKGPGVPFDPAIPYLGSGTIKPAPMDTRTVLDDFDDNKVTGWIAAAPDGGALKLVETNKQFTINRRAPSELGWRYAAGWRTRTWSTEPGKTLEWRVELVSLSEHANASALEIKQDDAHAYFFIKGHDYLMIGKWMFPDKIVFACEKTTLPSTDILLSGAIYRGNDGDSPATVEDATRDGAAKAGQDFVQTVGILEFVPGEKVTTTVSPFPVNLEAGSTFYRAKVEE